MAKFEENLTALESVVDRLERGDLSLEDSVKLFEEGVKLSGACKAELDGAEGKIQLLVDQGSKRMAATSLDVEEDASGDSPEADEEE
jgi:exodeoxyribonuclease VII small subunit